jgi:hypothetical protein
MAKFNPNDYETVAERITRFYNDNPNGRIITTDYTSDQDRQVSTWRVKAEVWLPKPEAFLNDGGNDDYWFLKATGVAFEVDGGSGANSTSALENCETSAIGRALANAGYSGDKRTTREEMEKVNRGVTPRPQAPVAAPQPQLRNPEELFADIMDAPSKSALRGLWNTIGAQKDHLIPDGSKSFGALIIARQSDLPENEVF